VVRPGGNGVISSLRVSGRDHLVELNDPRLAPLIRAAADEVEREVEHLIVAVAQPVIASIAARYTRSGSAIRRHDTDDITGTINLRLVAKLRAVPVSADDAVRDFERFVATLTYNVINDHLRKAFPARARLKNRLRYSLTHDSRLALWTIDEIVISGLSAWRDARDAVAEVPLDPARVPRSVLDPKRAADALVHIFERIDRAVVFDGLVAFAARIWNVSDAPAPPPDAAPQSAGAEQMETREYLRSLWSEIRELRPLQRKALLLNLRSTETADVASLLVLTGVATFDELASVLEMTPRQLAEIWNDLPLDDLRIAAMLGVSRQQVINLRQAARTRLARRMSR
jgi:DNA-directed RNA polymerase specialized sigma24 family protein